MELLSNSTFILNVIIIGFLLMFLIVGYKKGAIKQFFNLFSLMMALLFAWIFYIPFGKLFAISPKTIVPFQSTILQDFFYVKVNQLLWFVILFIAGFIFMKFLSVVFNFVSKVPGINLLNKVGGLFFGLINFVVVAFITIFFLSMPIFTNGANLINNSLLSPILNISEKVVPSVVNNLEQYELYSFITNKPNQASVEDVSKLRDYLEASGLSLDEISKFLWEIENE